MREKEMRGEDRQRQEVEEGGERGIRGKRERAGGKERERSQVTTYADGKNMAPNEISTAILKV